MSDQPDNPQTPPDEDDDLRALIAALDALNETDDSGPDEDDMPLILDPYAEDVPRPADDDAETDTDEDKSLERADLSFLQPARPAGIIRQAEAPKPESEAAEAPAAEEAPEPETDEASAAEEAPEPETAEAPQSDEHITVAIPAEALADDEFKTISVSAEAIPQDTPADEEDTEETPEPEAAEAPPAEVMPASEAAEAPPVYRYRVAVPLKPEHETLLNLARQSVNLPVATSGIFAWGADFYTSDPVALQAALEVWSAGHLPLTVRLDRVEASVLEAQRYVAALRLEPAEPLAQAHAALQAALADYRQDIPTPEDAAPLPFAARLPVSDHTPATAFPALIRELQTRFMPEAWTITQVELLRADEVDGRWEVEARFGASS
ncbi:MAG: hypothetical protein ACLFTK_13780 [Anaerolineales bacterium]